MVAGDAVTIEASEGTVGRFSSTQWRAWPRCISIARPGPITSATTSDGQFSASADLAVVNGTVDWTLGARGGPSLADSPSPSLYLERKTPSRASHPCYVMFYQLQARSITGGPVEMKTVYPTARRPSGTGAALAILGRGALSSRPIASNLAGGYRFHARMGCTRGGLFSGSPCACEEAAELGHLTSRPKSNLGVERSRCRCGGNPRIQATY